MGLATAAASVVQVISPRKISVVGGANSSSSRNNSMSHQGIFSFSSSTASEQEQQQHHVAQQSRRDKLRMQGFEPAAVSHHHTHPLLVGGGMEEEDVDDEGGGGGVGVGVGGGGGIYEAPAVATNMLSEMFNFPAAVPAGGPTTATELLASQIHGAGYRLPSSRQVPGSMVGFGSDWYGGDGGSSTSNDLSTIGDPKQLNSESAAAMQLFLMNPQQQQQQQPRSPPHHLFHDSRHGSAPFVTHEASFSGGGHQLVDSQGLSLSLSSSLHQFEMAKAEQNVLYFNQQPPQQQQHQLQTQGYRPGPAPAVGVNLQLRNSRYARPAQELLEEFCSVGRGQHFRGGRGKHHHGGGSSSSNPNPTGAAGASTSAAAAPVKDIPPLSPADRFEHQRNKSKLLTMLDEVDRRYSHYCDQMQMVVTSFDAVMGYGAATPYTALAQKAMSRHFRCLKDAIGEQLRRACEALGEKDTGAGSGITKGETPRLRLLDQSLRQQRAFHQMGMIEQEAWRPQRGLPERSVTALRAWLFEHFLHPYPSDADKHLLARQTGLSRNQVSNWFINARVRLWKPMVEEMYQQESKDETDYDTVQIADDHQANSHSPAQQQQQHHHHSQQQQVQQRLESEATAAAGDSDHTSMHQRFSNIDHVIDANILPSHAASDTDAASAQLCAAGLGPAARMRLGTAGDVSLTLGLRHAGTGGGGQDINRFTVRDHFGDC